MSSVKLDVLSNFLNSQFCCHGCKTTNMRERDVDRDFCQHLCCGPSKIDATPKFRLKSCFLCSWIDQSWKWDHWIWSPPAHAIVSQSSGVYNVIHIRKGKIVEVWTREVFHDVMSFSLLYMLGRAHHRSEPARQKEEVFGCQNGMTHAFSNVDRSTTWAKQLLSINILMHKVWTSLYTDISVTKRWITLLHG